MQLISKSSFLKTPTQHLHFIRKKDAVNNWSGGCWKCLSWICLVSQMADSDFQSPAEVSQKEQETVVPQACSSQHGMNTCAPSPEAELHAGGQGVWDGHGGEKEEDGGSGADKAFMQPRPPLLHLRRGTDHTEIHGLTQKPKSYDVLQLILILNQWG